MDALLPQAIGCADCESLSSFIQRLAKEHGTYPGQFVFRIFSWLDTAHPEKIGQWAGRPGRLRIGFNINSFSHADVWLRSVQRFTRRADLTALTTRHWDHVFPTRGFQHSSLAWCPFCLEEDLAPYHRLAWFLQPVRVCLKHRVMLQRKCMRCGKAPPVLHDRSHVTACPWCGGDLRVADPSLNQVDPERFDYWSAKEIGAFIATGAEWYRAFEWQPSVALKDVCSSRHITNASAFGRFIGTSKLTTWYWLTGKARPSLGSALRVYHRFGLSLASHVLKGTLVSSVSAGQQQQHELHLRNERHARQIDWQEVTKTMESELRCSLPEAPTFISVANKLGIARRTLRAHEPRLCAQLATRNRERRKIEASERASVLAPQIDLVLQKLSKNGETPQWRDIEKTLQRPGLFNSHYARRVLRQCLRRQFGP